MRYATILLAVMTAVPGIAAATEVRVIIENLAPTNGNFLTPVWVGFHNGQFDIYDSGAAASAGLERLAEDGNTGPLSDMFMLSGHGAAQATLASDGIPPLAPGQSVEMAFELDALDPQSRYFSYASMLIPSNDAFIANGNGMGHRIFADDGTFLGADFFVLGTDVLDAGTEVNDELAANTAFFGQMNPNTGADEGGVVGLHAGFNAVGTGGILDAADFANADFARLGYPIAQIRVVPEPATVSLLALGAFAMMRRRRAA